MLYRAQLHELLATYRSRFSVVHALSRADVSSADGAVTAGLAGADGAWGGDAVQCMAGERVRRGRVDASLLSEELGAWVGRPGSAGAISTGSYFLVVGTKAMERDAWRHLQEARPHAP